MESIHLFDDDEREDLRKRVVEFWAGFVAPGEIAWRLSTTPARLRQRYGRELARGRRKWTVAAIVRLNHRALGGDTDSLLLMVAATMFDNPGISALLACPGTRH